MRDLVFSAATVGEAVASGAAALGLEPGNLRYVVIESGSPAVGKRAAVPARIAVLAERRSPAPGIPVPGIQAPAADPPSEEALLRARLAEIGEALSRASEEDIRFEMMEDDADAIEIRVLADEGSTLLWKDGAEGFRALEHLLRRVAAQATGAQRVVVSHPAYRAHRESALREKAQGIAATVRADGVPRVMEKLNSYERRIVHMALTEVVGVHTHSEGEGDERLLVIEPMGAETASRD